MLRWTVPGVLLFLVAGSAGAQSIGVGDPLFQSDDVLEVTFTAPFAELMRKRPNNVDLDGTASWRNEAGETITVDVGVRTRGNYRRQREICPFAPIRLNFKTSQLKGTVFENQDKLKLVTHCRNGSERYQQIAFKEFLAYKMLNLVTDLSYRVRMLHITYVDSVPGKPSRTEYGFVIEHKDRLGARTGLAQVEIERTSVAALDPMYTNLTSIYAYLIGNTDYSPIMGAKDEICCHNAVLFSGDGTMQYALPYDFDMSGMVDSPYAEPNPRFGIKSVRRRLYRGRCANNEHIPLSIGKFQGVRAQLYSLVEEDKRLSNSSERSMEAFLDSFFKAVDNPRAVESRIVKSCLKPRKPR